MAANLNAVEIRILGSLVEKALHTSDYDPRSLNALLNACNQKSSRDSVVAALQANFNDLKSQFDSSMMIPAAASHR